MHILVTAGPTREAIDAVRFLTNGATGRLGIEIAHAAAEAGHTVELVLGPTHLVVPSHRKIAVHRVTTGVQMLAAAEAVWPTCDALIATAAVSDHRPATTAAGKPEKASGPVTLELVPNPDILATLAATKGARRVIGFALQVEDAERKAREKLIKKNLDAVVLDAPAAMGSDRADFTIILRDGSVQRFADTSKRDLARHIISLL